MATDMHWRSPDAFEADLHSADEARLRAIHTWASAGEVRATGNGRHSSPSGRRAWKARRQAVEAIMESRGLEW